MIATSLLFAAVAVAADAPGCGLEVVAARTPQAPPVAMMWAGYATLRNRRDTALSISAVSSPDFASAQIHETRSEGGVEHMQRIDPLRIDANASVELAPGGKHVMLMHPTHDLAAATQVSLTFTVAGCAAPLTVVFPVRRAE